MVCKCRNVILENAYVFSTRAAYRPVGGAISTEGTHRSFSGNAYDMSKHRNSRKGSTSRAAA